MSKQIKKSSFTKRTLIRNVAEYMVSSPGATIRKAAYFFDVPKTTIHNWLKEDLKKISSSLYEQVQTVLAKNKEERHIRGGLATKGKYKKK